MLTVAYYASPVVLVTLFLWLIHPAFAIGLWAAVAAIAVWKPHWLRPPYTPSR
jgi:hypothetical protein